MEEPFHFTPINLDGPLDDHFIFESPQTSPQLQYSNLDSFTQESWQFNTAQQSYPQSDVASVDKNIFTASSLSSFYSSQYNFLQSSLSSDIKIQNLDDVEIVDSSPNTHQAPVYTLPLPSLPIKPEQLSDGKSRPSKKRKKNDEEDLGDVSFVRLPREQLLIMSSYELEERVKYLQQQRPLTAAENEEIKRQRKLIKNREYAQTSRTKKRETLSTLKGQLGEVSLENEILKTQVSHLSQRVQYLEQENNQLRSLLAQPHLHPQLHSAPTGSTSVPIPTYVPVPAPTHAYPSSPESSTYSEDVGSPSVSTDEYDQFLGTIASDSDETLSLDIEKPLQLNSGVFQKMGNMWGMPDPYTRGLCLLVVLFSFGLFFNGIPGTTSPASPSTARMLFEDPGVTEEERINALVEQIERGKNYEVFPKNLHYFSETDHQNKVCRNATEENEHVHYPTKMMAVY